jgi:hypothetical protein
MNQQLSPRTGIAAGLVVVVAGFVPILGALEVIHVPLTADTPVWVGVATGMVIVLAGLAVINEYAVEERRPRPIDYACSKTAALLGFGICGGMAIIFGWIAFGPGERHFAMTTTLPIMTGKGTGGESPGRAMFGLGTALAAAIAVSMLLQGFRRKR